LSPVFGSEEDEIAGGILHGRVAVEVVQEKKGKILLQGRVRSGAVGVCPQVVAEQKRVALIRLTEDPHMNVHAPIAVGFAKPDLPPHSLV
jgi:hypothetical protein